MRGYRGAIIFVFLCRHFQQEAVNANLGYRYKQSFVGFVEVDGLVGWFFFHANLSSGCCSCFAGCADLNSLDSLSPQEKKRQGYIHELIETEEKYVEDLQIVLEVISHKSAE